MAFEPGGIADKLGNRYEGRWVAKQLIKLLNENLLSVTVESIGPEEQGVDLVIVKKSGIKQLQQCKSRLGYSEHLTASVLNSSGILNNFKNHLSRDLQQEFALVSPLPGLQLSDICESARISNGNPKDFFQYQIKSKNRIETVKYLFCALGLSSKNENDCEIVFNFLKRFFIELFPDDKNTWADILMSAGFLLTGAPETAISALLAFIENEDKFRKPVYADELRQYLAKTHNIFPKRLEHDSRILPVIEELQHQFSDSIAPRLIQKKLITRNETAQIIESIDQNKDVVLHGVAGNGKSSVLYELTRSLHDRGIQYLPIRLDRRIPDQTAKKYGESLGLPESPAYSLSVLDGNRKCVLILDQLDAIRWTSAHSTSAMDVCKELLRQVFFLRKAGRAIVAIVACRTFDLENDPEIKRLLKEDENNSFNRISVREFSTDQLRDVIGADIDVLTAIQRKILLCPQNLSIWMQMKDEGLRPEFRSAAELMRRFWANFRQNLGKFGIAAGQLESFLGPVLDYMEKRGEVFAPEFLVAQEPKILNVLKSCGILQNASGKIGFCHQRHLDFLVAERIARSVSLGTGSVVGWLGTKEMQSLFRREQLRQILCLLVDQSPFDFYETAIQVIESANVRFHLKSLVLELIGQLAEISNELGKYCVALIGVEKWREHVYETVLWGHYPWVSFLINTGKLSEWLCSPDDYWLDKSLMLLRSIVEDFPDMVAEILAPFLKKGDKWLSRILHVLSLREALDSEKIFELRLSLARKGFVKDFVDWQSFARKFPIRPIMLIEAVCATWNACDEENTTNPKGRLEKWYDQDLVALSNVAKEHYLQTWDLLMPQVNRLTSSTKDFDCRLQKWRDNDFDYGTTDIYRGIVELLVVSGKELAQKQPEEFLKRVASLNKSASVVVQEIIGEAFASLSPRYADNGLLWLLENPSRFELGFGYNEATWMPAVRLIKSLSKFCSDKLFERLEFSIIHYHGPNEKRDAEYYLKCWQDGYFGHYWGKSQYFLLPALDEKRTKKQTKELVSVLNRKFKDCSPTDFLRSCISSGGWVGSKLEQNLDKISDKHWLRIISNKNVSEKDNRRWIQSGPDRVVESSIRQFSGSLMRMVGKFPERFGKLALRFGDDTHPSYVSAIINGFLDRSSESESEKFTWSPARLGIIEAVLDKFHSFHDRETAAAFCSLISEKSGENWSDRTIARLINYASKHPDLKQGKLNVHCDVSCDDASISVLFDNVLNCVRGKAARAIGQLLSAKKSLFEKVVPGIDSLVRDPHPVVRIAAIEALFPVLNVDKNLAVNWFFNACEDDLRVAASPLAVRFFNYVFPDYFKLAEPVVQKMICSTNPEIAFQGARQAAARNFFYGIFEKEFNDCLLGTVAQRRGVVDVAVSLFNENGFRERCSQVLIQAMNDPEKEVRETLDELFKKQDYLSDVAYVELVKSYIKSKAFADDPDSLVWGLTNFCGKLDLISESVFAVCERFPCFFKENEGKTGLRLSFRADEMFSVLLRLYENAQDEKNSQIANRCLDMWDLMLEKRVGRVAELTKAIEK